MSRFAGVNQVFVRRNGKRVILIIEMVIDDLLVAGISDEIRYFKRGLEREIIVGKTGIRGVFKVSGCEIYVVSEAIELSKWEYLEKLKPVDIYPSSIKQKSYLVTADEEKSYRGLAGTLMYMGNAVVTQDAMVTSRMQQNLGNMCVIHVIEGNANMQEMVDLRPYIRYIRIGKSFKICILSLSDASNGRKESVYSQTGGICGLFMEKPGVKDRIYHPVSCTSHKQIRVSYSSFGA